MSPTIAETCMACGDCRDACPEDGAIVPGDIYRIDWEACVDCGACINVCPTSSIYKPRPNIASASASDENSYTN